MQISELLGQSFGMSLTPSQQSAVAKIGAFCESKDQMSAFILRGYAGTGKTTLIGTLVKVFNSLKRPVVLLAPTGRAAKVLSLHAGQMAFTIHKVIYRQETFNGEQTRFSLGFNKLRDALFIVDEASMLQMGGMGETSIFGSGMVMDDLVKFVYQGSGCRLMLIGDDAQLPPVGESESPALNNQVIGAYGLQVFESCLTDVVRQEAASGVLSNATLIRQMIQTETLQPPIITGRKKGEVEFVDGNDLVEKLDEAYNEYGVGETIVVTRSNKRANLFNEGIRRMIFDREEAICRGDYIMVVKNNYFWAETLAKTLPKGETLPFAFIANGDTARVVRIFNFHEAHGFHFADAVLEFPDYDDFTMECRVMIDTLLSESPSLSSEESHRLYESVLSDYADIPNKRDRMKNLREDSYYNALQIKHAYAVTCHKAQGGQWSQVFIDQGYISPEMMDISYFRWLYTAFTRATENVYLVNWPREQRILEKEAEEE
ncbi:MAG: AAA family ATPase [Bacteroidaceae bacterium]|nr:AAA family ATPase [Bacteroidaceae bacterium]